mgnify:CR=1 FL=1
MSHHSLPSILTPVLDPKHQVASVYLLGTYMLIVCIYITMGMNTILTATGLALASQQCAALLYELQEQRRPFGSPTQNKYKICTLSTL